MARTIKTIIFALLFITSTSLLAQSGGLFPTIKKGMDKISKPGTTDKSTSFQRILAKLKSSTDKPRAPVLTAMIKARLSSKKSLKDSEKALQSLNQHKDAYTVDNAKITTKDFIAALQQLQVAMPKQASLLIDTANSLDRMNALGFPWADYFQQALAASDPALLNFIKDIIRYGKLSLSPEELKKVDQDEKEKFIRDLISKIPTRYAPALNGPVGGYFNDVLDYNKKMWRETTSGIDLVSDAIETGKVDTKRLKQITSNLENLGKQGPWGSKSATDFLRKIAEKIPGLDKLIDTLFPKSKEPKDKCTAINCDCDNLEFGILTGPYRKECRASQAGLRKQCRLTGKVQGRCHPTASGPNPYPK